MVLVVSLSLQEDCNRRGSGQVRQGQGKKRPRRRRVVDRAAAGPAAAAPASLEVAVGVAPEQPGGQPIGWV